MNPMLLEEMARAAVRDREREYRRLNSRPRLPAGPGEGLRGRLARLLVGAGVLLDRSAAESALVQPARGCC